MSLESFKFSRLLPALVLLAAVCLTGGWILAGAADNVSAGDARALLQRIAGADFKKEQVQIKKIGGGAIVEAQIETAFRFVREGRDWKVAEVRLGDRHWESLELIDEAIKREKTRRTAAVLDKVATSLAAYHSANGQYVVADDFTKLLEELAPRYLGPIVQFDLWGTPLKYQGQASRYRLVSAGPDRVADTPDDLVIETGVLKSVAEKPE